MAKVRFTRGSNSAAITRPIKTRFTPDQLKDIEFLSKLGATVIQFAEFFEVSRSTAERWMMEDEGFRLAKKRGGLTADMKVAQSLYMRAIGFEYQEESWTEEAILNKKTGEIVKDFVQIKRTVTKKRQVGDVKAAIHWLRNRQREFWSEVSYKIENYIQGDIKHSHIIEDIDMTKLSKETQEMLFELGMNQMRDGKPTN